MISQTAPPIVIVVAVAPAYGDVTARQTPVHSEMKMNDTAQEANEPAMITLHLNGVRFGSIVVSVMDISRPECCQLPANSSHQQGRTAIVPVRGCDGTKARQTD